jgi:Protein phosphatase 2C
VTPTAHTRQVDSVLGHLELCNVPAPDKKRSEDLVDTTDSAAWLFDGTNADDDPDACDLHDASWFVQQLSHALTATLNRRPAPHLRTALANAIAQVGDAHAQLCPRAARHRAAATAVIVRRSDQALEYLVLGDSALLVQTRDKRVHHHSDKRLSTLAPAIRDSIHRALRFGRGYHDPHYDEAVRSLHTVERAARNRQGGFWIAEDDPRAAMHSLVGTYSLADSADAASRIALISDGVERAVTRLCCYTDWYELLEALFDPGVLPTIERIRRAERSDPDGTRYPRTRPTDDAAAIACTLS